MHRQQNSQSSATNEFAMYPSAAYHSSHSTLPSLTSLSSPSSATSTSSSSAPSSSRSLSASSSPILLSVLTWSLTFLLISSCINLTDARTLNGHPLSKRSFFDIQCKGVYDKSIFARLDRICEDCYNLFREPQLHMLCKKNCFTTDYFKGCLDVLLLSDEVEKIQMWIKQLHGADPGV
ncbi:PREDICTED: ion transport peptide-like [Dinoponera quadriceps]|uniref:Ion transport peptide-like n=1 Tax=Dinoponera quadriceps TaxID=609295 RepID=A0A6P3XX68_DINQU|nr:PREDICTED: ion transport peptide-like [Dinoponera quadriceps]XP_014482558.1 PREDICTED: ion transport peptide-like [Dinoponera quadriceps]XP_014482559.1 PREDICTED: ion transport peptide-like [Dinoponera quadriceps]